MNHSLMRHPHIIQFRDVFVTSEFICIVLEYAGTGTLHAYVRRTGHLRESVARWFFQQLTVAVDYCHKKGVANRDIKLENTLLHVSYATMDACNLWRCRTAFAQQLQLWHADRHWHGPGCFGPVPAVVALTD